MYGDLLRIRFLLQMATLLGEQEEKIDAIETAAGGVAHDTEGGYAVMITYAHDH